MGRFCYNCGTSLKDDARFCPNCGSPQKMPEPVPVVAAPAPAPAVPASSPVVSAPAPVSPVPVSLVTPVPQPVAAPSEVAPAPRKKGGIVRWIAVILLFFLSAGALLGVGYEIWQLVEPYDFALKNYMRLRYGGEYDMSVYSWILPNDYWKEMQDSYELQEDLSEAMQSHRYEISSEIYGRNTEYSYKVVRKEKLPEDHDFFDSLDDRYDLDADQGYIVTVAITLSGSKGSKVILDSLVFMADGDDWFYFNGHDFLP